MRRFGLEMVRWIVEHRIELKREAHKCGVPDLLLRRRVLDTVCAIYALFDS
jgi:hypothetical protein